MPSYNVTNELKHTVAFSILTLLKLGRSDDEGLMGKQRHQPHIRVDESLHYLVIIDEAKLNSEPKCSSQVE